MKLTLNAGYKLTSRAVSALIRASSTRFTQAYDRVSGVEVFNCGGHIIKGYPAFGRYLLSEYNSWMIDCGLVNVDVLRSAHMVGHPDLKFFSITE